MPPSGRSQCVEQADAFLKRERDKYVAIVRSLDIQPQ
jgi:hypothetical protein